MSDYRSRNQLLLAKIEAASGTEESPTPGSNAVKVRDLQYSPTFQGLDTNYVTGSLTRSPQIVGGGNVAMRVGAWLKGDGIVGQPPDYGVLLRACGLSETILPAAATGTATAGAASTITLAAGASAVTDAYKGMVISTTGGTGTGQTRVISAYNGTTKVATVFPGWITPPDATTGYSIAANALYRPVSTGLETATLWGYQHHNNPASNSRRRRIAGAAGSFDISITPRGLAGIDFTFAGLLPAAPDDVAKPASPTYQSSEPQPFLAAQAYLGETAVKFSEFRFSLGGQTEQFDNPAAAYGYDPAAVTARNCTGRIVPNLTLLTSRDAFADWLASTSRGLWLNWGTAAGKRVSLYIPAARYTGNEQTDVRGFAAEGIPFQATGDDSEIWISVH